MHLQISRGWNFGTTAAVQQQHAGNNGGVPVRMSAIFIFHAQLVSDHPSVKEAIDPRTVVGQSILGQLGTSVLGHRSPKDINFGPSGHLLPALATWFTPSVQITRTIFILFFLTACTSVYTQHSLLEFN